MRINYSIQYAKLISKETGLYLLKISYKDINGKKKKSEKIQSEIN